MEHIVPTLGVLAAAAAVLVLVSGRYEAEVRRLVWLAFLGHAVSACVQVWITEDFYGGGDMLNYAIDGRQISRAMEFDFASMAVENVKLFFHQENALPVDVIGGGMSSSGTMSATAGFLLFALGGSLYAACMFISMHAFFGTLAMYRVVCERFTPDLEKRVLFATMLVPSVVFWGAGILKESIAIAGMGWMFLGVDRFLRRRFVRALGLVAIGGVLVWAVKAYILFPFVIAAAAWVFWERVGGKHGLEGFVAKPVYFVVAAAIAAGATVVLSKLAPQYAVENLVDETARYQEVGRAVTSTSSFEVGDASRSFGGQLLFTPVALFNSLFRPLIFEVRNPLMLVSAAEMSWLLYALLRVLGANRWADLARRIRASPLLVFSLVFTVLFGVAVGLVSTNLGTLARYRMPLMPFYVLAVFVLGVPERVEEEDADEAPSALPLHQPHARVPQGPAARSA
jgi:hypothetical protein